MSVNVTIVKHALVEHKLTILRNKNTNRKDFKTTVTELTYLLISEASKNFDLKEINITTPLEETTGKVLQNEIVIVPVMRAGIGMLEGANQLLRDSQTGFIGIKRDETTQEVDVYLNKLGNITNTHAIVLEPMLATGNTLVETINLLKKENVNAITIVTILAVKEGIDQIVKTFQNDIPINLIIGHLDPTLNEHAYITPGLGDAGDRLFNNV